MKIIHLKVKELIQQEAHLECGCTAMQPRRSPLSLATRRALGDSGTEQGRALGSSLQGFHWELGRLAEEGGLNKDPAICREFERVNISLARCFAKFNKGFHGTPEEDSIQMAYEVNPRLKVSTTALW